MYRATRLAPGVGEMCEATAISVRSPARVKRATPRAGDSKASGTHVSAVHTTSSHRGSCQWDGPTAVAATVITISGTAGSASLIRS